MGVHWAGAGGGDESAPGGQALCPQVSVLGGQEGNREGHGQTGEGCEGELCPGLACLRPSPGILMVLQALGANVGQEGAAGPPIFGESSSWAGGAGGTRGRALCSGVNVLRPEVSLELGPQTLPLGPAKPRATFLSEDRDQLRPP